MIFAESDRQSDAEAPVFALAQAACHNCLQLSKCQEQLCGIASTLLARDVEYPVIGAEIVPETEDEIRYATKRERLGFEPHYEFDLSQPLPRDPQTAAEILRQMVCVNRGLINGTSSAVIDWATNEAFRDHSLETSHDEPRPHRW